MAAVMLIWCGVTLLVRGPVNKVPIDAGPYAQG